MKDIKEALECWEKMQDRIASNISTIEYITIKQALQQAEKEHKALEIIKKRQIDITDITETTDDFELYQAYCIGKGYADEYICNKEEFELLKQVLENE